MKTNLLVALLMFMSIFTACAHGKKTMKRKAVKKHSVAATSAISSVTMRRGACFGRCPEYTITIKNNGTAEYNGFRNAEPLGVYEKNIGAKAAQDLLKQFMDYRVDTCQSLYTSKIADVPSVYFAFIINGKEKKVANAHFGPEYFLNLAEAVDALGKPDKSWKKISDKAGD